MLENHVHFLWLAILFGLSSGLSPGPLLTLVVTQTIKHDRKEGVKVAISPLITDLPIVFLALFVFKQLAESDLILAIISFLGGAFIAYLGIDSIRTRSITYEKTNIKSQSFKKGIIANFLNPHPYVFWLTVNAPLLYKAYQQSLITAIMYLVLFYSLLIGSKIFVAQIVFSSKVFLNQRWYNRIMVFLGIALLIFSFLFFWETYKYIISLYI